jgi:hypothetical protein
MHSYWGNLYKGTPAELAIEPAVASLAIPYRFQHPYFLWGTRFFPDFIMPTIGVILEVDDPSHDEDEKKAADALRTATFEKLGYVVVRCTNEEALSHPYSVVDRLIRPLLHRTGPGLPPAPRKRYPRKKKKCSRSSRS